MIGSSVPFKLTAENRQNIVPGLDKVLELGFEFGDGADTASGSTGRTVRVLQLPEKRRCPRIPNGTEVERRKQVDSTTLFVVDDIAGIHSTTRISTRSSSTQKRCQR